MLTSNSTPFSSGLLNLTNSFREKNENHQNIGSNESLKVLGDFSEDNNLIKTSFSSSVVHKPKQPDDVFSLLGIIDTYEDKEQENPDILNPVFNDIAFNEAAKTNKHSFPGASSNSSFSPSFTNELLPFGDIFSFRDKFDNILDNFAPTEGPTNALSPLDLNATTANNTSYSNLR